MSPSTPIAWRLAALLAMAASGPGTAQAADRGVALGSVEARLVYNHTATFSGDVPADYRLLPPNLPATNNPSSDTLLIVHLTGPAGGYQAGEALHVAASWRRPAASPDGNPAAKRARLT